VGEKTVSVQVTSVVRASDSSFQVKWTETAFERGVRTGTSNWTGILTVVQRLPTSAETLRRNPLGIYVDAIDWSRELEPTPAPPPPPAQSPSVPLGSPLDPNLALEPPSQTATENRQ
jgi:type IV secretion system protein VirB5